MSEQEQRERFEKWANSNGCGTTREKGVKGKYHSYATQLAWDAWLESDRLAGLEFVKTLMNEPTQSKPN